MKGLIPILIVLSLVSATRADASALTEKGAFDTLHKEIEALITLKLDGARVQVDRSRWEPQKKGVDEPKADEEMGGNIKIVPDNANANVNANVRLRINRTLQPQTPFEQAFAALQTAAGGMATARMSSGSDRSASFRGELINGRMEIAGDRVVVVLTENADPFRSIELTDDPAGVFRLTLLGNTGDLIMINQSPGGGTSLACIVGETKLVDSAKTFGELSRKHRGALDSAIHPVLQHVGIGLSLSADSPEVHAKIVAMLTPASDEDRAAARALLKDLDSPDFATREAAREQLLKVFDRYRGALVQLAGEAGLSNDAKASIQQINAARASGSPAERIVVDNKLLDDPKYLARMLAQQDVAARKIIITHLEKLSGQSFGDDPQAWEKWASEK
jgi:hypothetical protein